jgi:hypothetical protein
MGILKDAKDFITGEPVGSRISLDGQLFGVNIQREGKTSQPAEE